MKDEWVEYNINIYTHTHKHLEISIENIERRVVNWTMAYASWNEKKMVQRYKV